MPPGLRKFLSLLFKVSVSGFLLYFLFTRIDISSVGSVLGRAHTGGLLLGWVCYMVIMLACSVRWRMLTVPLGFRQGFYDLTLFMFAGAFFNLFLPTSLGGDVGRAYYLARGEGSPDHREGGGAPGGRRVGPGLRRAVVSVLVDRGMGMMALLIIASAALSLYPSATSPLPPLFSRLTVSMTAVLAALGIAPFFLGRAISRLGRVAGDIAAYWERPGVLVKVLAVSLLIQVFDVLVNIAIGYSLDLHIPILYYFVLTPLILVASMFPSLAGLGVREGAYVYLLSAVGVHEATALAVAVGWLIIVVTASIIGAVIIISGILDVPWEYGRNRPTEKEA